MEDVSEDQKPSRPRRARIPPKTKATEPSEDIARRKRTFDDFFNFCNFVLAYEEQLASSSSSPLRGSNSAGESSHSSTPSQSSGSSSGPELSEDEDPSAGELSPPLPPPKGIKDRLEYTSDDESWNLVTCFCRRPFAGRPMIECNCCKTWVHLFCAKIKKDQVPDTYYCPRCRASGSRKEKRRKVISPEEDS